MANKENKVKENKVPTPKSAKDEEIVQSPIKEITSSQTSLWIAVAVALVVGLALGAGVMFSQNADQTINTLEKELVKEKELNAQVQKEDTPSEVLEETPVETPTTTSTATPTTTPTATSAPAAVGTTSTTVILEDPLSGNRFEYALKVPINANVVKDTSTFAVNFAGGGSLFVEQRYEAYEAEYASFTTLSGELGTFYRVSYSGGYTAYVGSVQKVGTCASMDGPLPAPCGLNAYSIASKNFLGAFTCDGASNTECDTVMKTVEITKL